MFIIKIVLILIIFIYLYKIPEKLLLLYNNDLFKILYLTLIFLSTQYDILISILLTFLYILPLYKLNQLTKNSITFINNIINTISTFKTKGGNASDLKKYNKKTFGEMYDDLFEVVLKFLLGVWVNLPGVCFPLPTLPPSCTYYKPTGTPFYIPEDPEDNLIVRFNLQFPPIDTPFMPAWLPNKKELHELVDRILAHDIPIPQTIAADYTITQLEITKKFIKKYLNPNTGKLFYNVSDIKSKPNNKSRKAELDEYLKIQKENENKNVKVNSSGYSKTN
jgi:hypothetical protein